MPKNAPTKLRIEPIVFDGFEAVQILTAKARLVLVTSMGPRVAWFGAAKGRNLLFWDERRKYKRKEWHLMGGHRVWALRPGADESEESYMDDNAACEVSIRKNKVTATSPAHPAFALRKSIAVEVLDDDTFQVTSGIHNDSPMLWSGGTWGLTATLPQRGVTYGVPLGDGSPWDMVTLVVPKRWGGGNTSKVTDKGVKLTEDCLVYTPSGIISKRAVGAPQGVIGMTDVKEGLSFVKKHAYDPTRVYPMNANIAYYNGRGNFMVEMESMGPLVTVPPGASNFLEETWMLRKPVKWAQIKGMLDFEAAPGRGAWPPPKA